ncbi:MAG: hypothetical protein EBS01_08630 [Verrucomicrobia bacterium]|nr:hypothetical protein [Verrucomicrobiota bacterium]
MMLEELETLLGRGEFLKLGTACDALLQRDPNTPLIRHVRGLLNLWSGEFEAAQPLLSPEITRELQSRQSGDNVAALLGSARSLREAKQTQLAFPLLIRCLLNSAQHPEALREMAECLLSEGRHREAAGFFRALSRLDPENPEVTFKLGMALLCAKAPAAAIPPLHKAAAMNPGWFLPWRALAMAFIQNSQHAAAAQALQICTQLAPDDPVSLSQKLFSLHYCPAAFQGELSSAYESFATQFSPPLPRPPLRLRDGERIRIGYVSADFREHPVSFFIEPLLAHHDPHAFEVFLYSNNAQEDAITQHLRSLAPHWRNTEGLSDAEWVEQIQRDAIHVLVDLSGHTAMNRLPGFGRRPAPLQITMIGTMLSTGMSAMDYRVTCAFLDPEGAAAYGSEAPMRLEAGAVVFQPPVQSPEVAPAPAGLGRPFTFASLNDPAKITEETLVVWAKILQLAPHTRLLLVRRPGNPTKQILEQLGISGERIIERDYQPLLRFLKMFEEVDLALDPFPYNGLTVTLQSCWMGVPPVTLLGDTPPSRAAGMILDRMGLDWFIAKSLPDYVQKAVHLAQNPAPLAELRLSLRERTLCAWGDAQKYTREFEDRVRGALSILRDAGNGVLPQDAVTCKGD